MSSPHRLMKTHVSLLKTEGVLIYSDQKEVLLPLPTLEIRRSLQKALKCTKILPKPIFLPKIYYNLGNYFVKLKLSWLMNRRHGGV